MTTLLENTRAVGSSAYFGDRPDWLIAFAMRRDSDTITRSNFRVAEKALRELPAVKEWPGEDCPIQIERFSHWAVGWCDYLIVNPECKPAVELAEQMREKVENYPILCEHDHSDLEHEEAETIWRDCYRVKDRLEYVRRHRSQFEFRNFSDLLGCIRGKYFAGYDSELCAR